MRGARCSTSASLRYDAVASLDVAALLCTALQRRAHPSPGATVPRPARPLIMVDPGMFHVKQPCVPVEHFGDDRDPDWRVELRPGGTFYWIVTDWHGELVAHGVKATLGEAVTEAVRWAT